MDELSPDAGDDFVAAIEKAERTIAVLPSAWPPWPGAKLGVHRYLVPGTLYAIAYRIRDEEIVVLAVAHQRRSPRYGFRRDR